MLGFLLAAGLSLGPRPLDLVKAGEEANYAQWLEGEARKAAGYYARKDCAAAVLKPRAFTPVVDEALSKARPGAPLYAEQFDVEGCGEAHRQGLIVLREQRWWRALPTAPGESQAPLSLQREVLPSVILEVKRAAEQDTSCTPLEKARSALIYDTRITRPGGGGRPWSERWSMWVCAMGYKVDIDFAPPPPGSGGRIVYLVQIAR